MFTFKVVPDSGDDFEVTSKSRDIVRWEKRFKRTLAQVQRDMSMAALTELAYVASERQGKYDGDYQAFADAHDIELAEAPDEDADPTRPDR